MLPDPPVSVTVTLPPGATVVALTVSCGPEPTVNVNGADVPPPGAGVKTVTATLPAVATSAPAIDARSCVALRNVVARSAPFQRMTHDRTKVLPGTRPLKEAD